jgi:transcription antitermination factor NusG
MREMARWDFYGGSVSSRRPPDGPRGDSVDEPAKQRWYAVETKTRLEQTVESLLRNKGYETFLPLYKVRRQWSDRIKLLDAALFPGYLFSRLGDGQRTLPLLTTPFVRGIVSSAGRPLPVPEEEVEAVRAIVASGLPATPWPYLQQGDRVRIRHGSLAGVEGLLLSFKKQHRLVVSVELLRRSVAVEIDIAWVEPAGSPTNRPS